MKKTFSIWQCDSETALRLRVLALNKGITVANMLESLVNEQWDKEQAVGRKITGHKIKKITGRWLRRL